MKKRYGFSLLFLGLLFSLFLSSNAEAATNDMYRLYNPNSGEHFYTANTHERDLLKRVGWNDEGIGWYAPTSGDPVYRMYNPNAGDHHYTPHKFERDHLIKVGWRYEGIGWYSDKNKTIPLYRAYNPNARAGSHNYTVNKAEQNHLIKVGWRNENIAWYGAKRDVAPVVNKKELQRLYNKVKDTSKGSYTDASWKTFQSALSKVKSVLADGKATQAQVNSAKTLLQNAFNGLEKKPEVKSFNATADNNGSIIGTANGDYKKGTPISVTATPDPGYRFKKWTTTTGLPAGIDTSSATISFEMPSNAVTLVAEFEEEDYTFSATAGDNGSITGTENGDYTAGTPISVTAQPAPGYKFKKWTTTTGLPLGTDTSSATISFEMPSNAVTLVAEFEEENYTFSATAGDNGSITGTENGDYTAGTPISVTAQPAPGYKFKKWTTTTGLPSGTETNSATISFEMPSNAVTLVAEFEENYTFNATAGDNGSITGTGNGDYTAGIPISVTATPAPGYKFKKWTTTTGLPSGTETSSATISFEMPSNAVTLVAEFEQVYQIGDYYPIPDDPTTAIGVVFEISEGGSHGKIVSLDQINNTQWADNQNSLMLGTTQNDGLANMQIVANYINDNNKSWSNFPIFDWIHNTKNVGNSDYQNTIPISQWYLPAKYELESLFCAYNGKPAEVWENWNDKPSWGANDSSANAAFNSKLTIAGGTMLNSTIYRTSSEDGTGAYCVDFSNGRLTGWVKHYSDLSSLAIAKF